MDPIMIPILGIVFGCTIPVVAIWAKHKQKLAQMQINSTAEHLSLIHISEPTRLRRTRMPSSA